MRRFPSIHERFLRHIWSKQYLTTSALRTSDGKPLRVLSVGTLNLEGGPDFTGARVKIGATAYVGDVEIHRTAAEWFEHLHQEDPRYNKVILHVVLEGDALNDSTYVESGRKVPLLLLEPFLSESIHTIWQKSILDERARKGQTIKCFRKNGAVDAERIRHWLKKLSVERLELKLRRFEERLQQLAHEELLAAREPSGHYSTLPVQGYPEELSPPQRELTQRDYANKELWEQLLYEGIMEGLGYSKNREPFVRLAKSVTLRRVTQLGIGTDEIRLQALLFGAAGLLPKPGSLKQKDSKEYAKQLNLIWKEIQPSFRSALLHAGDWQFFPTRPLNFPTLRLAGAAPLIRRILAEDMFRSIIQQLKSFASNPKGTPSLASLFQVSLPEFWQHHYRFDESTSRPTRALGQGRINELVINTVLPIALLYARIFREKEVREGALRLYDHMPSPGENSVTRLMDRQLLRGRVALEQAGDQQGVIQLFKYYCTEERCLECDIGRVVFDKEFQSVHS